MVKIDKLPYNINDLKKMCGENKIIWKEHAVERLVQRRIRRQEVIECIKKGEIIDE